MKSKRCIYCGIEFSTVQKQTIDHIFPLMTDGQPTQKMVLCYQNLGLCCSACNSSKSNKCHEQWMLNKQYSTNRLVLINEQVDLVPTFSDEIYQLILMKYKTFMTNHLHNLKELVLLQLHFSYKTKRTHNYIIILENEKPDDKRIESNEPEIFLYIPIQSVQNLFGKVCEKIRETPNQRLKRTRRADSLYRLTYGADSCFPFLFEHV